jgi:hypothetical protein
MQVCTIVAGKAALIASGKPFSPSTTAIRMSWTPRFRSSFITETELCPLVLGDPHAQDLSLAVAGDAEAR